MVDLNAKGPGNERWFDVEPGDKLYYLSMAPLPKNDWSIKFFVIEAISKNKHTRVLESKWKVIESSEQEGLWGMKTGETGALKELFRNLGNSRINYWNLDYFKASKRECMLKFWNTVNWKDNI